MVEHILLLSCLAGARQKFGPAKIKGQVASDVIDLKIMLDSQELDVIKHCLIAGVT